MSTDLIDVIVGGPKAEALEAIARADLDTLEAAQVRGLRGDWRRAEVAKRIATLKAEHPAPTFDLPGDTAVAVAHAAETVVEHRVAVGTATEMGDVAADAELRRLSDEERILGARAALSAETAKADKKAWESKREEVVAAVYARMHPPAAPLFDQAQAPAGDYEQVLAAAMKRSLAGLGLTQGTLKALAEAEPPIVTIGDLTERQKAKGDWWASEIAGIGKGKLDQIADAMDKFWADFTAAHPAPAAEPDAKENEDDAGPD